jgi:quercetin dioxygenase-like cupin family protein
MSAVRAARIDELPPGPMDGDLEWRPVRHQLGIEAFGAGVWSGDAGVEVIEEHTELDDDTDAHEELYVVMRGRATFTAAGETIEAPAGTLVAITDPGIVRKAVADEDGTAILAIGAPRGRAYEISPWERSRVGA